MGTFHVRCKIENPVDRSRAIVLPKLLVDTGSEFTWIPEKLLEKIGIAREKKDVAFQMANGVRITRSVGFGIIRLDKYFTIDEVVFGEEGDLTLLGARTLEGLNLVVEPSRKRLVAAGPLPAAAARRGSEETPLSKAQLAALERIFETSRASVAAGRILKHKEFWEMAGSAQPLRSKQSFIK